MRHLNKEYPMLIDWFTVIAQIIAFSFLCFSLSTSFTAGLSVLMDQKGAYSRLDEAEAQKKRPRMSAMFKLQNQNFDSEREEMISNAKEVSESFEKDLMQKAREEIDGIQARWHRDR